jgi:hypothetical protein
MKSLFAKKNPRDAIGTSAVVEQMQGHTKGRPSIIERGLAGSVVAMESLNDSNSSQLSDALTGFKTFLSSIKLGDGVAKISVAQEEAALTGAIIGSNPGAMVRRQTMTTEAMRSAVQASQGQGTVTHVVAASEGIDRIPAMEAFDERANANAMVFTAAYNMQSSKQNEFAEAFYPTITIAPDQVGFNVNVRLLYAYQEVVRSPSGSLNNFNRRNIIKAIIDATILQIDQTRLIPVYRSGGANDSTANFASGPATTTLVVDGANLTTAPLAFGKKFSILGVSQTDAQLVSSTMDQTDAVDSSVRLQYVYLKLHGTVASTPTTEYFKIEVVNMPTSDFNAAVQGNTRLLSLRFSTKAIFLSASTKLIDGSTSQLLAPMSTNTVRLGVTVTGEITQDLGDTILQTTPLTVEAVVDNTGLVLSQGSGAGQTVAAIFTGDALNAFIGYDLLAYRTNSNRRNRGKLIDIQHVNFLYTMPLLPPITALRPVSAQDTEDGNLLSTLVTATRIQTSNAAVTALLATQSTLKANAGTDYEVATEQPTLFGAASLLVTPAYREDTINCATDLDSLNDAGRIADLSALLINTIRDMAVRLYTQSGYGPALEAMYEGTPPKITVIIGTDPIIYRYLMLQGDTRLTGEQFDYKIVQSFDSRMAGKLLLSFGLPDAFNSGVVNPLHFGNMGWKPEITLMLPMVRNGANVMELTVQPSYRHVTNLPIMGSITVSNIDVVIGSKVAINNHPV